MYRWRKNRRGGSIGYRKQVGKEEKEMTFKERRRRTQDAQENGQRKEKRAKYTQKMELKWQTRKRKSVSKMEERRRRKEDACIGKWEEIRDTEKLKYRG